MSFHAAFFMVNFVQKQTDMDFSIDGFIEQYLYSKSFVKWKLSEYKGKPVNIRVNSLGGDVDHALNIMAQFRDHGDVTVEYVGFNASAATLIGLAAKQTKISASAFYLIHKALVYVDEWGAMNADDLEAAIARLKAQQKNAETVTLSIAKLYMEKTGKTLNEILDLMKEERWLSATEAVELGFVDEVVPETTTKKTKVSNEFRMLVTTNGLPALPENAVQETDEPELSKSVLKAFTDFFKSFGNKNETVQNLNQPNKNSMEKKWTFVNSLLVVGGLQVTNSQVSLSEEQMTAINARIETLENDLAAAATARTTAENSLRDAQTASETATNALSTVVNSLDGLHADVAAAADNTAKVEAVRNLLGKLPAAVVTTGKRTADGKPDFSNIAKDPVNNF